MGLEGVVSCNRCIMDASDPNITFDADGLCDYCRNFESNIKPNWHTDARGEAELTGLAQRIKDSGRGKDFDCIIGLSGGLDGSWRCLRGQGKDGVAPFAFPC